MEYNDYQEEEARLLLKLPGPLLLRPVMKDSICGDRGSSELAVS